MIKNDPKNYKTVGEAQADQVGLLKSLDDLPLAAGRQTVDDKIKEAFKAGWLTNAVGALDHQPGVRDYFDGCAEADWKMYQQSPSTYLTGGGSEFGIKTLKWVKISRVNIWSAPGYRISAIGNYEPEWTFAVSGWRGGIGKNPWPTLEVAQAEAQNDHEHYILSQIEMTHDGKVHTPNEVSQQEFPAEDVIRLRGKIVELEEELERQHVLHDNLKRKHGGLRAKFDLARSELASLKGVSKLRKEIGG